MVLTACSHPGKRSFAYLIGQTLTKKGSQPPLSVLSTLEPLFNVLLAPNYQPASESLKMAKVTPCDLYRTLSIVNLGGTWNWRGGLRIVERARSSLGSRYDEISGTISYYYWTIGRCMPCGCNVQFAGGRDGDIKGPHHG